MTAIAVTIAGSDSGGGAGIQADLKTFSALGVYGASVITALTAQNTRGVTAIHEAPPDFVRAQMDAVFSDLEVNAVKIGMLANPAVIEAVAEGLRAWRQQAIVLDPVMIAASGDPLLRDEAVETLIERLMPMALVATPNLPEAARLTGQPVAEGRAEMLRQGEAMLAMGPRAVLLKGGHAGGGKAPISSCRPRGRSGSPLPAIRRRTPTGPAAPCRPPSPRNSPSAMRSPTRSRSPRST